MKKVFALFVTTALCVAVFLPVLVRGKKSSPVVMQAQTGPESVVRGAEVQIGEHAVSAHVRTMPKGKDKGKHLSPDKDYRNVFNPDGLTRLGYTVDPVVQTSVATDNTGPSVLTAPAPESPQPAATTQLLGNPGFENGSATPAPWTA